MTARILSQHNNVIAADFRPSTSRDLTIHVKSEVLYSDELVILTRTTAELGGKPLSAPLHFLGDFATGHIVQLNNG